MGNSQPYTLSHVLVCSGSIPPTELSTGAANSQPYAPSMVTSYTEIEMVTSFRDGD